MMIGTRDATGPVSEAHFVRQWYDRSVAVEMKRLGFDRPEQLGALFIGDAEYLRALVGTERPLTDDDPKRIEAVAQSDAGFTRLTRSIRDTTAARERFRQSPLIARLWPAPSGRRRSPTSTSSTPSTSTCSAASRPSRCSTRSSRRRP